MKISTYENILLYGNESIHYIAMSLIFFSVCVCTCKLYTVLLKVRDEYRSDYDDGRGGLGGGAVRQQQYGRSTRSGAEPMDTSSSDRVVSMQT